MQRMITLLLIGMGMSSAVFAAQETCYEVSFSPTSWSRTPESLCLMETGDMEYMITLKSGLPFGGQEKEIAKFNLTLLQQARCMDCNANLYGVGNPSNSVFNALAVHFDGKIDRSTRKESGTVFIGQTKLFYRSR